MLYLLNHNIYNILLFPLWVFKVFILEIVSLVGIDARSINKMNFNPIDMVNLFVKSIQW